MTARDKPIDGVMRLGIQPDGTGLVEIWESYSGSDPTRPAIEQRAEADADRAALFARLGELPATVCSKGGGRIYRVPAGVLRNYALSTPRDGLVVYDSGKLSPMPRTDDAASPVELPPPWLAWMITANVEYDYRPTREERETRAKLEALVESIVESIASERGAP